MSQAGDVQCTQYTFGVVTTVPYLGITVLRQEESVSPPNRVFEANMD